MGQLSLALRSLVDASGDKADTSRRTWRAAQRHQHRSFRRHHDDDAEVEARRGDLTWREMPLIRTTLLVALMLRSGWPPPAARPQPIRSQQVIQVAASDAGSRFVPLGIGKSVVIDLPRDVKDVLVADPKIANAVIRSARRAYIIGSTRRTDQRVLLRPQRPADHRPRYRGDARPQRAARRDPAGAAECRHPGRGHGRGRRAHRQRRQPDRGADRLRHRVAPGGRWPQGRERHHRCRAAIRSC